MLFQNTSIRQKILLLPLLSLLLFLILITGDFLIKDKFSVITAEKETCYQLSLLMSRLLHLESDFIDSGSENELMEITETQKHITNALKNSSIIVPEYLDQSSGLSINDILAKHTDEFQKVVQMQKNIQRLQASLFETYGQRNTAIQQKVDEITRLAFELLMGGENIRSAKNEFANSLKELTSLDTQATLNTTELYHISNEADYLAKESALQERVERVARASDALSFITEDKTDRDTWRIIIEYQHQINTIRDQLYTLWQERQELARRQPITHEALVDFSQFINSKAQDEIQGIEDFHKTYNALAILSATMFLVLVSYLIIRNILHPINNLNRVMKQIMDGERESQVEVKNRDELGNLTDTFNSMIASRKAMTITLEENEKKFRRLLESTSTIPWELDLESLQFTFVGTQAEKILGYPVESWTDFTVWADRVHPDDRENAIEYCNSATKRGEDHDFVYRAIHRNGSIVWILDIVTVVSKDGKPQKLVGFMHDITQQKLAEEEKSRLEERLQQAEKMEAIGTLAGGIAHDFNNILGIILGYAGMAKEDAEPGSSVDNDLEKILLSANRAKELVRQILAFSRQSRNELRPFKPAIIVQEAVKMLRSSIPTTIQIREKINPNCETILADTTQVHQILMNLGTNAYHAMEKTGGILSISLDNVEITLDDLRGRSDLKEGKFVQLTVSDTGPGIDPTIQDKIFDPYFTTKETGKGTGMGLSIAHGIITSYGGMITFESSLGEGTTFRTYFPANGQQPSELHHESEQQFPTGKERILFVDDEELLNELAGDMLGRLGYAVTTRTSSMEALEVFQNQPDQFDLVITDQTMPGMTGEDMARRMLQIRPNIPIILCTGFSANVSEDKIRSLGIREFVMKPLLKKDLAILIRKVLDKESKL